MYRNPPENFPAAGDSTTGQIGRWIIGRPIFGVIAGSFLLLILIQISLAETRGDAKIGRGIYMKNCASCHGQKGEGLGLLSTLPNFADVKYMRGKTDKELFDKITNGGKGTGMPAWDKLLTEQERWHVLAYIRVLSGP